MNKYIKIIVVGDGGVGKTTLLQFFTSGIFNPSTKITIFEEYHEKALKYNGINMNLIFFDIAGYNYWEKLHKSCYQGVDGALLTFDLTRYSSLNYILKWGKFCKEKENQYPTILVGLKYDLLKEAPFFEEYALKIKNSLNLLDYVKVSSKTGKNVNYLFSKLIGYILITKIRKNKHKYRLPLKISDFKTEKEIEDFLKENLDLIEPGLQLIDPQSKVTIKDCKGFIDLLCLDKFGRHVVIEIKKQKGYYNLVGQIQFYLVTIAKKMHDHFVRGILVVIELSNKIKYSIKASKFPIEIIYLKDLLSKYNKNIENVLSQ